MKRILIVLAALCVFGLIVFASVKQHPPVVTHHVEQGADSTVATGALTLIVFSVIGLLAYFIPSLVAKGRNRASAIFVLNLLLGWTLLGWVGALIWAMCEKPVQAANAA